MNETITMMLDKGEVEFLAARVKRLCAHFGYPVPDQDDRFIVGVAGALIGAILTNLEIAKKREAEQPAQDPVAWVRFCSDGSYEGPIMDSDSRMDGARRKSGAWTPLYAVPKPHAVDVPGANKFFAYDDNVGFELFDTVVDAKKAAQESIDEYRAEAGDGWASEVENVCWGLVLGVTREIDLGPIDDDGSNGVADSDRYVDYVLTAPIPQPASSTVPPFAGHDPKFCPGSNPDSPQTPASTEQPVAMGCDGVHSWDVEASLWRCSKHGITLTDSCTYAGIPF